MYSERLKYVELVLFLMSALFVTAISSTIKKFGMSEDTLGVAMGMGVSAFFYLVLSAELFFGKLKERYAFSGGSFLAFYSFCVMISFYDYWMTILGGGTEGLLGFLILLVVGTSIIIIPLSLQIGKFAQIAFPTGMLIGHWILIIFYGLTSHEGTWLLKILHIFSHQATIFSLRHFYICFIFGGVYYVFYYYMQSRPVLKNEYQENKNPLEWD